MKNTVLWNVTLDIRVEVISVLGDALPRSSGLKMIRSTLEDSFDQSVKWYPSFCRENL
jgi:hypothetical protein